jgi:hypothetical protein
VDLLDRVDPCLGVRLHRQAQIAERNESGGGMATAGIVLGWVGVGFLVLFLGIVVVAGLTRETAAGFE